MPTQSPANGTRPNTVSNGRDLSSDSEPGEDTWEESLPELPYAGFSWVEGAIIVGASLLITAITFVTALTSTCCAPSGHGEMMRGLLGRSSYLFLWALSTVPLFWACVRLRPGRVGWPRSIGGGLFVLLIVAFLVEWGQSNVYMTLASIWPPEKNHELATGPLGIFTSVQFLGETVPGMIVGVIGIGRYQYLKSRQRRDRAKQLRREAQQLRAQLTAARLEALRMQLNPHFLFNTLHTISTMAGRDPEGIQNATARLSELLRYALSTSDQQEVSLDEELEVLDSYLEIQKMRLGDRLSVSVDVDPDVRHALVPTLFLQPLAENAVKHGFEGRDEPGHLLVEAERQNNDLVIRVADDGRGVSEDVLTSLDVDGSSGEGHGLDNLTERLRGLYGDQAAVTFSTSDEGGLCVEIRLPFRTDASEENLRTSGVQVD